MGDVGRSGTGVDRHCHGCGRPVHPMAVVCTRCGVDLSGSALRCRVVSPRVGVTPAWGMAVAVVLTLLFPILGLVGAGYLFYNREATKAAALLCLALLSFIAWLVFYSG